MMFSIVAIQIMVLDYTVAAEEMQSWSVQLKWQYCNPKGDNSLKTLVENLRLADQEDFEEEVGIRWFLPVVKKKAPWKGRWVLTNGYHKCGADLSKAGLWGRLKPVNFGWDVQHVPGSEKERFRERQHILVSHSAWFQKSHPDCFWLRS